METADEIVACDQPNSSCSGSSSTLGTDRKPAAPISVTNPTAATGQARCSLTALRSSISVTRRAFRTSGQSTSGLNATMCQDMAMGSALASARPHRVAVLALEPVVGFDLTIAPVVFDAATGSDGTPLYDVQVCGLQAAPIRTCAGFTIVPDHGAELLAEADTVVIPGTRIPQPRF